MTEQTWLRSFSTRSAGGSAEPSGRRGGRGRPGAGPTDTLNATAADHPSGLDSTSQGIKLATRNEAAAKLLESTVEGRTAIRIPAVREMESAPADPALS
jgi:hypothetical protein